MNPLTEQEIEELDRAVDASVPSLPLSLRRRDVALIYLLRFHESYMLRHVSASNRGARDNANGLFMSHTMKDYSIGLPATLTIKI
jgi:hypothetical protein